MMLPLWFVLLLCMMSAAMGFFACSMIVIAKQSDEKQHN